MKQKNKIVAIIMLIITILSFATISYGFGLEDLTGDQSKIPLARRIGNNIVSIITSIASVVSVVMLIILGIKYMMGSTAEKAEYKKTLLPYVIGATLVFAASNIAQLIYNLVIQI